MESFKAKFIGAGDQMHDIEIIQVFQNNSVAFVTKKRFTAPHFDWYEHEWHNKVFSQDSIHFVESRYISTGFK